VGGAARAFSAGRWPDVRRSLSVGRQPDVPRSLLRARGRRGKLPGFRRVSADRTFGGDDLWHMDLGAQDGPGAAGSMSFLPYRAVLAVSQPITGSAAAAWLSTRTDSPA